MIEDKQRPTIEEGIKLGFLEDKTVFLKPIFRDGKMIKDKNHQGYFMWEGASKTYVLNTNAYGELIDPFKNEQERKFFESMLSLDLNPRLRADNFWHKFGVRIIKDVNLMERGIPFKLNNPEDNLRVRILKLSGEVIGPEDDATLHHKFRLIDEDYTEKQASKDTDQLEVIWTFFGEIKDSDEKMNDFLSIYLATKGLAKIVPKDSS